MQVTLSREVLARELALAKPVSDAKSSVPVLAHVLIQAHGPAVTVTTTDLDLCHRGVIPALRTTREGACCLPTKKLLQVLEALVSDEVTLVVDKDFNRHSMAILGGETRVHLNHINAEDFPLFPSAPVAAGVTRIPGHVLSALLQRTSFAITTEDARYYLAGALLLMEPERVAVVATDGHRLAYANWPMHIGAKSSVRLLMPRGAVQQLQGILAGTDAGDVLIRQAGKRVFAEHRGHIFTWGSIEGQFPAFERVFDEKKEKTVYVHREALLGALCRVRILADQRNRVVKLACLAGRLELSSFASDVGDAREAVPAELSGEPLEIGFNVGYLIDFLNVAGSETVAFHLSDGESGAFFVPVESPTAIDYRYYVMPVRL